MHKVIVKVTYLHERTKRKVLAVQFEAKSRELTMDFLRFLQGETRETGALMVMTRAYARGVVERAKAEQRRERKCS